MPEAIKEFFATYGLYINIALGAIIFLALTTLRNKLADFILNLVARVLFVKKPDIREGFVASLRRPLATYFVVLGLFIGHCCKQIIF